MYNRYSVPGPDAVKKTFQVKLKTSFKRMYHTGAFDHPKLPVITNENPGQVDLFQWGLIPFWVKDQKTANQIRERTANARCETIYEKPSFRHLAGKKHCLVIADGFYEWRWYNGKNYPYFIRLKNHEPFGMAGLWEAGAEDFPAATQWASIDRLPKGTPQAPPIPDIRAAAAVLL